MKSGEEIKAKVRQKYGEIALRDKTGGTSCCGDTGVHHIMSDDYTGIPGYQPAADLGLGCGLPTQYAGIKPGDVVIDLGSGAGNDCFIARGETGADGKVIGIDFTAEMILKARENAGKLGFLNVEFRQGDIEDIPVPANTADVVVSNCVLNLVPDKNQVFREIYRILKPGGHFSISDVVLTGDLPEEIKHAAEMYAGCVAGAIRKDIYLELIRRNGFEEPAIRTEKIICIPDEVLAGYLNEDQFRDVTTGVTGIVSITVSAGKPNP